MAMYQCDQCPKLFSSKAKLWRHQARVHGKAKGDATGKTFEVKKPIEKVISSKPDDFYCINCGSSISKGQTPCPKCGEPLNWEGIA